MKSVGVVLPFPDIIFKCGKQKKHKLRKKRYVFYVILIKSGIFAFANYLIIVVYMMQNPFITFGYAGPEYFCDRIMETEKLKKLLLNGNNIVLMSQRRLGKTGLLYHTFAQEEIKENYNTFIIDIYSTKTLNDLVFEIGKAILGSLKSRGRKSMERFLDIVSSLKPGVTFDIMGNATWNLEQGTMHSPSYTLDQIFEYLNASDRPCIVAIDEFQQIMYYPEKNVEETLRTYIQKCSKAVFVFSGSERHLLSEMFHSPARPFYASTTTLPLGCIDKEKYIDFAISHFRNAGKTIVPEAVAKVYERFEGVTWFMQKTMNQLFFDTGRGETCTPAMVDIAVREIICDNSTIYEDLLYQLTSRQRDLLVAINREGKAKAITGSRFIRKHHLSSASTIQTTIKSLQERQLVTRTLDTYEVYDKFFALWLMGEEGR